MSEQKETKKQKTKPKYNVVQNVGYMLRKGWQYSKMVLVYLVVMAVASVGVSVLELFLVPVILQRVETHAPLGQLVLTTAAFAGGLILLVAINGFCSATGQPIRIKVRSGMIGDILHKRMSMSFPYTEDSDVLKTIGKIEGMTGNNSAAVENIWLTMGELLKNLLGFVLYLLLLTALDPMLLVVVLVTAGVGFLVREYLQKKVFTRRKLDEEYSNGMWYVSGRFRNSALAKDLRIFGMRDWLNELYGGFWRVYRDLVRKNERQYLIGDLIDVLMTLLRNGVAYFYLITKTLQEGLPASEFLLYFTAISGFAGWITGILSIVATLHRESLDISILREFLELPDLFRGEDGETIPAAEGGYTVELRNVSFRYPSAEKNTLEGINLTIPAGEKLAVVGLNGAGKTTLIKLICGFYDPTEGEILLNGVDIRKFDRREYYKLFAAVFQQVFSVATTLAENVSQDPENTDMERVKDCIEKAGLREKVESLPKGYDTQIGRSVFLDGVEFSGGEMQRLMLARALYKNGGIIVLDEPTAALDPIAENEMYLKYNEMTKGRTAVYISHRLASTRFCDRIIFLDEGKIQEEGTHDGLMEQGGRYAELFQVQSKYYGKAAVVDEKG